MRSSIHRRGRRALAAAALLATPAVARQGPCAPTTFVAETTLLRAAAACDGEHFVRSQDLPGGGGFTVEVLARDPATGAFAPDGSLTHPAWGTGGLTAHLAVERGRLAVGVASGGVSVYRRGPAAWALEQDVTGVVPSLLGAGVRLWGDLLFVPTAAGIAVVERDPGSGSWAIATVLPPRPTSTQAFGVDLDFDGRVLVVGDHLAETASLFARSETGAWSWVQDLPSPTPGVPGFAFQVEIEDLVVLVGHAPLVPGPGIEVFRYLPTLVRWAHVDTIPRPAEASASSRFGQELCYSRGEVAVSAPLVSTGGGATGRVYVYKEEPFTRLFRTQAVVDATSFPPALNGQRFGERLSLVDGLLVTGWARPGVARITEYAAHLPGTTDCDLDGMRDVCQIRAGQRFDDNRNGFPDPCELSGQRYCGPAVANSTGVSARLNVFGPPRVLLFYMEFHMAGLPPGAPGYVLSSRASQSVTNPGIWLGDLCVGGTAPIARALGGVQRADRDGRFWFVHNRPVIPTAAGLTPILPGQTWHFQCWYQDPTALPRSNFSDAVAVTFTFL